MFAICVGGQVAAKERLRRAGWWVGNIQVGNTLFEAMSKMGVSVVFEPKKGDDGYASLPGTPGLGFGWQPLPRGNELYEEAMDCLSDVR